MSKPILELQNGAKWQLIWNYSAAAEPVPNRPGYAIEIPPITTPFLLENHIIALSTKSTTAKPSWKVAGRVARKFATGITSGGTPDVTIRETRRLWLNEINLFRFTPYTSTYALEVTPAYYLTQIDLALWVYIGVDTDTCSDPQY